MRFIPEKVFDHATYYIMALYVLALGWSPYASAFTAYTIAGVMLLKVFFCKQKNLSFLRKPEVYYFATPAFLFAIGLFYSQAPRFKEFLTVAPILAYSFGIASFKPLSAKQFRTVMILFIFSITILAATNFIYFQVTKTLHSDVREMSLTMSHIRFSLLCNIAILTSLYYIFWRSSKEYSMLEKYILWAGLIILFPYLLMQQSLAGVGTFTICAIFILIKYTNQKGNERKATIFWASVALISSIFLAIFFYELSFFLKPDPIPEALPQYTLNGNKYEHYTDDLATENGHRIALYICAKELDEQWPKYSSLALSNKDEKKQPLIATLYRYLTSKNLTKDSVGLSKLNAEDIKNIENGITNYRFTNNILPNKKIYTLIWEINIALEQKGVSGHSATQRLMFQEAGLALIKDNFWFGYGTADLVKALHPYYEKINTQLSKKYWLAPHNQFISFFCMFGLIGFSAIIASYILLIKKTSVFSSYFKSIYFIIVLLSMLFEDTISTQAGVVLYGFFGALFLFGTEEEHRFSDLSQ